MMAARTWQTSVDKLTFASCCAGIVLLRFDSLVCQADGLDNGWACLHKDCVNVS